MTLTHRIMRRLGYDTTAVETHTMPIYEYRIIHTNGEVSEVIGHGYNTDGAFARFYEYKDVYVSELMGYSVYPTDQEILRVLDSIKEIKRERVGDTLFKATIDLADGSIVEKSIESFTSNL
jgi:hypothetical protein